MADILIRKVPRATKALLRLHAERRGRSLEADLRDILEGTRSRGRRFARRHPTVRRLARSGLTARPRSRRRAGAGFTIVMTGLLRHRRCGDRIVLGSLMWSATQKATCEPAVVSIHGIYNVWI